MRSAEWRAAWAALQRSHAMLDQHHLSDTAFTRTGPRPCNLLHWQAAQVHRQQLHHTSQSSEQMQMCDGAAASEAQNANNRTVEGGNDSQFERFSPLTSPYVSLPSTLTLLFCLLDS